MLCTRFLLEARGRLAISATLLLLGILALPSGASANAQHRYVSDQPVAASSEQHGDSSRLTRLARARAWTGVVRFGSGYSRSEGSRRVRWIQWRLRELGYAPGPLDGRFGPLTDRAVRRFQTAHRVQRDGDVGPITAAEIRHAKVVVRFGAGYTRPGGSRRVRSIQQRLRELGYAPGPTDGRFGPLTERALTRFQADHRLTADGQAGPNTLKRLRPRAVASPSPGAGTEGPGANRHPAMPVPPAVPRPPIAQRPAQHLPSPPGQAIEAVLIALAMLGLAVFAGSYVRTRARLGRTKHGQRGAPIANGDREKVR
jgi:peptidoglycan hydrolase-like protein with peptidoglycan-binding domain